MTPKPGWLGETPVPGATRHLVVASRALRAGVRIAVWAPVRAGVRTRLPLLVVHDGPAYERESGLTRYAGAMIARGRLPPHRVALLAAEDRDEWYSASARYARALTTEILPAVGNAVAVDGAPVGMGASLGGLAMVHAEHRSPGTFAGLFAQSASFFTARFDGHESGFERFRRIARFVGGAARGPATPHAPPTVLTCGREEENLDNNRAFARALASRGWPVELHEVAGMHDHVAWRDALDPHLTGLLARVWGPRA
ncbi:MAG TPA: alpha/beta hydrolase-fold protein [Solirubrobacteraceae bacterium]|nr:alpha/beta hydrolase-fold protein [Solirubrobacteraceae bacterium]